MELIDKKLAKAICNKFDSKNGYLSKTAADKINDKMIVRVFINKFIEPFKGK